MADTGNNRLYGLQMLRFFAAFSVLLGHVMHEALSFAFGGTESPAIFAQNNFGAGVDVFFVISGFIMFYISDGKFGQPGAQRAFLTRRLIRLVPLYWLFTLLMLLATVVLPAQLAHSQLNLGHVLASFLFIPWPDSTGLAHPVLGLGWTLNYEMFFYVVFSLALLLPQRLGLLAITGFFVGLTLINALVGPTQTQIAFWTDPIILEFLLGIGLAMLAKSRLQLSTPIAVLLLVTGIAGIAFAPMLGLGGPYSRFIVAGIPASLIVAAAVFGLRETPRGIAKALVLGGDASYALYLSHPFSINVVVLAWAKLHLGSPWLFIATAVVCAIAGAVVLHFAIERPLLGWLNARFTQRPGDAVRSTREVARPRGVEPLSAP